MRRLEPSPTLVSLLVTGVLAALIFLGSRNLKNFDAALAGYAVATLFAVLGITYRFVQWLSRPPTALYWRRGWQMFFSWRNFRRFLGLIPWAFLDHLAVQNFIRERSYYRWAMHLTIFWGVVLSSLIVFPLVFGWFNFRLIGEDQYHLFVFGLPLFTFPLGSLFAFLLFHGLDIAALLVVAGVILALRRRYRDREVMAGQEFGFDLLPLLLLLAISITGLLLTASQLFWEGSYYWFLALVHQVVVIGTILYIPFGKLFHIIQRPASIGIELYYAVAGAAGHSACANCGREFAPELFVQDLKRTLSDLEQDYVMPAEDNRWWQDYCPECKRMLRATAYFMETQRGFL
ncbi:MAG: MFS transporter [Chloroflexi bacterium]|nr:MFS transporter [Chloroflexota bacterium]